MAWPWLAGCATHPAPLAPASPLAGTRWQLLAIESMSDEQPTARPAEPARYTLSFGADGQARLGLDCNRGSASWQASPAPGDTPGRLSGNLVLGPLASTRAMCAPPSLEPRLAQALPYVRSYLLLEGRLHLTLMADGGVLTWAPLAPAQQPP
ncbi:Flagellar hook-associated protein flgK [Rubrivivax sp. A210]|uniref:META domain-containing protein n=1 Tax=Rubrivivax sp. A210 TaxID=2772301 RepID=UPI00191908C6|nr:META domain-containing protein [Rubrivivax sp. A210]CAD5372883.1 Flagellar hook-associated protein flgK [Rubrivivax sp. A210]